MFSEHLLQIYAMGMLSCPLLSSSSASLIMAKKSASTLRSRASILSSLASFLSCASSIFAWSSLALKRFRSLSLVSRFFSCYISRSNINSIAFFSLDCCTARDSHSSRRETVPWRDVIYDTEDCPIEGLLPLRLVPRGADQMIRSKYQLKSESRYRIRHLQE